MTAVAAGTQFTWSVTGLSYLTNAELSGGEQVSKRGQVVTMTDALREANMDRNGDTWLDLVTDEEAQIAKYGRVIAVPGDVAMTPWEPNSLEAQWAREEAARIAHAQPDNETRAAALREVRETFGAVANPSRQVSSYSPGDTERTRILREEGRR